MSNANFLFKLAFNQEIRRVRCPENEKASIEWLNKKTRETFPEFRGPQLCFLYTDDENDQVTIKTQADLDEAFLFCQESGRTHLKLVVEKVRGVKKHHHGHCRRGLVHQGVSCDGCSQPIGEGLRFKCLGCPDFDFCEKCEGDKEKRLSHGQNHVFMRVAKPIRLPGRMTLLEPEKVRVYGEPESTHFGITCDGCQKNITGIRYKCAACCDFDFCSSCIETANETHPENHPFMKIISPSRLGLNGGSVICEARKDFFLSPEIAAAEQPVRRRCPFGQRRWRQGCCPQAQCGEKAESQQQEQQPSPQTEIDPAVLVANYQHNFDSAVDLAVDLATARAQALSEEEYKQQQQQQQVEAVSVQVPETPVAEPLVEPAVEPQRPVEDVQTETQAVVEQQPKEETKVEVVDEREIRYQNQLSELEGMGFSDRKANLAALERAKGSIERAIDNLLSTRWW